MRKLITRFVAFAGIVTFPVLAAAEHTFQTANVMGLGGGPPINGAATMFRTEDSVRVTISTADLDKKAAYTVWGVAFNNPSECFSTCAGPDLSNLDVGGSVFYTAGFVTGTDGTATVSFSLEAGDLADGIDIRPVGDMLGIHEGNGLGVELHFILRSHGKSIPGMVDAQIGSFGGACDLNTCTDQFSIVFLPIE